MFVYLKLLGEQLKNDYVNMMDLKPVSLAAKWIPSETSAINKRTALTFRLARAMKVPISTLRKKYITPLRAYIGILEQKMCANDWQNIDYASLPKQALKKHRQAFLRNDKERFEEHVNKEDDEKSSQLLLDLPFHTATASPIIDYIIGFEENTNIEEDWRDILTKYNQSQVFKNAAIMCDNSLSMSGIPMVMSFTLGILIAHLNKTGKILTFESNPQFVELNGASLYENVKKMRSFPNEKNTNICSALKTILDKAIDGFEEMPEKLIIVTDMKFNKADSLYNDATYKTMRQMFEDANFQLPHITFWNINNKQNPPVFEKNNVEGVTVVSGYSTDIFDCLLENINISSFNIMMNALNKNKFEDIKEVVILA
jgi:hypothetical protein